jgi:hypothetical protein
LQKEFTDNPGKTLNSYYTGVRAAVEKIEFPGLKVVMNETGLGANNEFTMKFTIVSAKPDGEKEGN